jgi:hypothetical protein
LEVSQTIPSAVQSPFLVQAGRQILRTQCVLLALQWLSMRQSMQRLFAVSQRPLEQSPLPLQVSAATHLLAVQNFPVGQSESAVHWTHTPRFESQTGSLVQSLLLLHGVNTTQRLPRQ